MNKYTAAVIGCGSIGALKPNKYDYPGGDNILTHAHAYADHPRIDNFMLYDKEAGKQFDAACKWKPLMTPAKLEGLRGCDIISLCVPTEDHIHVLNDLIVAGVRPKIILAEKPFGQTSREASTMIKFEEEHNFRFIVDYIRRFDPFHESIARMLSMKKFGEIYNCRIIYTRGLKHEACHALDLCRFFFGEFINGTISMYNEKITIDEMPNDPSFTAFFDFQDCHNVMLTPADGRKYSIFEVDILCEKGRIRFLEHGLARKIYQVIPEPVYGDYNTLSYDGLVQYTKLNKALYNLVDHAIKIIEEPETPILCSSHDAIAVHEIYEFLTMGG